MTDSNLNPNYYKRMPHFNVVAMSLTIQDFWELKGGEVLISPTGGTFVMGDPEVAVEVVNDDPTKFDKIDGDVKEIEFEDASSQPRRVIFVDGYAIGYDLLVIDGEIPLDTTGIWFDEDEEDWNRFVSMERCIPVNEANI